MTFRTYKIIATFNGTMAKVHVDEISIAFAITKAQAMFCDLIGPDHEIVSITREGWAHEVQLQH